VALQPAFVCECCQACTPPPTPNATAYPVAAQVEKAASGGDVADAAVALRLALILENVECRPQ
jgi:hypothetical protein